jgi:hypothetical protein
VLGNQKHNLHLTWAATHAFSDQLTLQTQDCVGGGYHASEPSLQAIREVTGTSNEAVQDKTGNLNPGVLQRVQVHHCTLQTRNPRRLPKNAFSASVGIVAGFFVSIKRNKGCNAAAIRCDLGVAVIPAVGRTGFTCAIAVASHITDNATLPGKHETTRLASSLLYQTRHRKRIVNIIIRKTLGDMRCTHTFRGREA